jgi:hypothetical protein
MIADRSCGFWRCSGASRRAVERSRRSIAWTAVSIRSRTRPLSFVSSFKRVMAVAERPRPRRSSLSFSSSLRDERRLRLRAGAASSSSSRLPARTWFIHSPTDIPERCAASTACSRISGSIPLTLHGIALAIARSVSRSANPLEDRISPVSGLFPPNVGSISGYGKRRVNRAADFAGCGACGRSQANRKNRWTQKHGEVAIA